MDARSMLLLVAIISGVTAVVALGKCVLLARAAGGSGSSLRAVERTSLFLGVVDVCGELDEESHARIAQSILRHQLAQLCWVAAISLAVTALAVTGVVLPSTDSQQSVGQIVVTAKDGVSQKVPLEEDSRTLSESLALAGLSPTGLDSGADEEPLLVAVKRDSEEGERIHYYPASLVWSAAASNLKLQDGDRVSLLTLDQTSLGVLDTSEPGVPFEVQGLIDRPGKYRSEEPDEVIMNVHTATYAGGYALDESGPDVMIVHRQVSASSPRERYYVPLSNPYADPILLSSRIRSGDVIQYARFDPSSP